MENETGFLVPRDAPESMAKTLAAYLERPDLVPRHGRAARVRAEEAFSLTAMVERYRGVYLQEKAD
jgi:glycosyltransferase involved in cell wall biosynthesis